MKWAPKLIRETILCQNHFMALDDLPQLRRDVRERRDRTGYKSVLQVESVRISIRPLLNLHHLSKSCCIRLDRLRSRCRNGITERQGQSDMLGVHTRERDDRSTIVNRNSRIHFVLEDGDDALCLLSQIKLKGLYRGRMKSDMR